MEDSIYDEFVERSVERAKVRTVGDPFDARNEQGPQVDEEQMAKILSLIDSGKKEGAKLVTGGARHGDRGYFVQPTLIEGLDHRCVTNREEIFGPCCHVRAFDDEDEVVALANDTEYGLAAALWTENVSRAHRVAARLEAGITWVNSWFLRDLRTPFGGMKQSGIGREGGEYSLEFYTETKNICVKL